MASLLELQDVDARYGPVRALHGVTLTVGEGEIVALLGANGAGKTTTLRAVSGTVRRGGTIVFDGRELRGGPEAVARRGVAHVPEGRGTFSELTVWENLRLGAFTRRGSVDADVQERARLVPVARAAPEPAGGDAVGRRAADARARARDDAATEAADGRRAVARARAARRRRDLSQREDVQRARRGSPCSSSSRTRATRSRSRTARTARDRARRSLGRRATSSRSTRASAGATWATDGCVHPLPRSAVSWPRA